MRRLLSEHEEQIDRGRRYLQVEDFSPLIARTVLLPTGLAAIAHVFLSVLKPGDHMLLADTIYGPARNIAVNYIAKRGIECEFYPGGHQEVAKRLKPNTRMVYLDNPGSIVFDIQDVPALAKLLKGRDTLLAVDNTWGCPGLYRPLTLGADISVVAITKYVAGHSDLVMGSISAGSRCARSRTSGRAASARATWPGTSRASCWRRRSATPASASAS